MPDVFGPEPLHKRRMKKRKTKFPVILISILIIAAMVFIMENVPAFGLKGLISNIVDGKPLKAVNLWAPPRVDDKVIPISFSYETNISGKVKLNLQIRTDKDKGYRDAAIQGNTDFEAYAGINNYSVLWDKSKDGISAGQKFDLKIRVSHDDESTVGDEMSNVCFQTRENIRNGIRNYLINYGTWTDEQIDLVRKKYQLVVVNTHNITMEQVQKLRLGKDAHDASDNILVLGYISVGEDSRTAGMTPEEMKEDPRFVLDGTGPSIDPRAGDPYPDGSSLPDDLDILGKPTNGGFAPFYLNDDFFADNIGEKGIPDFNKNFNVAFVNPGHPEWQKALNDMTLSGDRVSGMKEILNYDYGAGFGCDGLFLDSLDTAAPNSFTDSSSANTSEYEWVAKGTQQLLKNIRQMYPDKFLLANRGLFFYNPDIPAYKYTPRGIVDFVLFGSFKLGSSASSWYNESIFNDNKYNYAQKLMAEADRSDGFKVLSLGYAEGPEGDLAEKALHGEKNGALEPLFDDVGEADALGMVHYISNVSVTDINTFALDNSKDPEPPAWGSTRTPLFGKIYDGARVGIQKVVVRGSDVFVQWDVAHSMARPITYFLYIKEGVPFDFSSDLESQSRCMELPMGPPPSDYAGSGDRTDRYPYEAKVDGLQSGKTYYLLLRARNASGQYDDNTNTIKFVSP